MNRFNTIGLGKERIYLMENLAMLSSSGMTVVASLYALQEEMRSRRLRRILEKIARSIEGGSSLWRALENYPGLFSSHVVSLIRIGEEGGKLSENLRLVAAQEAREREFKSKIRSAMMYPVFVLVLTAVIGTGIAWFILPRLAVVFSQLELELPFITKVLIALGEFLGKHGAIAIPLSVFLLAGVFYFIFISRKTKHIGQTFLFYLPVVNKLVREAELARFGYLLGTLLKAGLNITTALYSLEQATDFYKYKNLYRHLRVQIENGNSIQKSFKSFPNGRKLMPVAIEQMISAGERSGALSDTLVKIGQNFENKTETTMKNLTVLLEPLLLVIVWLGVVGVALAVIFPIYSLIGGLDSQVSP